MLPSGSVSFISSLLLKTSWAVKVLFASDVIMFVVAGIVLNKCVFKENIKKKKKKCLTLCLRFFFNIALVASLFTVLA